MAKKKEAKDPEGGIVVIRHTAVEMSDNRFIMAKTAMVFTPETTLQEIFEWGELDNYNSHPEQANRVEILPQLPGYVSDPEKTKEILGIPSNRMKK